MSSENEKKIEVPITESDVDLVDAALADQDEMEKLREEKDRYLELARRTQADFDNYQKRAARETENERRFAQKPLAMDIFPAIDNLDRFLLSVKEVTALTKVVGTVQKQLTDALARQGIKAIEATDKPFDPNLHMAIMEQPSDKTPGTVLQIIETGYQYHDRILRPAKVIVAKAAS